jgi:succinoglycan biosynthesis transport protein ExoP
MDLIRFTQVLLSKKWLILASVSIAVVTTFIISRNAPKTYKASVKLETGITEGRDEIFTITEVPDRQKYEVEARFRSMENLIASPQVLTLVSYKLMLHDIEKAEPFRPLTNIRAKYSIEELRPAVRRYRTKLDSIQMLRPGDELEKKYLDILEEQGYHYKDLQDQLVVRRIPGTDYIGIDFYAENPYLTAFAANALAQEFIRYYQNTQANEARNSVQYLSRIMDEKKAELDEKMRIWEQYSQPESPEAEKVVNPTKDIVNLIDRLNQEKKKADQEILSAERKLLDLDGYFGGQEKRPYLETDISRGSNSILILRNRLSRMNNSYVRSGFTANDILDSLATTRRDLAEAIYEAVTDINKPDEDRRRKINQKIDNELRIEIARGRIKAIDRELRRVGSQAGLFAVTQDQPSVYGREVEIARDAYLTVLNKLNEAKAASNNVLVSTVNQIEFVQPPDKPEPSKMPLLVALAGIIVFAVAVAIVFVLEYLDQSVKYPSVFIEKSKLRYIGPLNHLAGSNLDLVALFSETHNNPTLENYKQLLRKIRHELVSSNATSVLVTSSRDQVGKTSLLISLAYSLSLSDKKVLIIDTNFKENSLTEITGASPVLEKYIRKEMPQSALISGSVFKGVEVIGSEMNNSSPAEILVGDEFKNLIEQLKSSYDYILMEGAPLNQFVDSRELATYAESVMSVFSATEPLDHADENSLEFLRQLEAEGKLMGAVLNKVQIQHINQ